MQILIPHTLFSPTLLMLSSDAAAFSRYFFEGAAAAAELAFPLAEEFRTSMQILLGLAARGRCCRPDFFTRFLSESVYRDAVHVDTASANTNLDAQNSWNFFASEAGESPVQGFRSFEVHKSWY